MLHFQEAKTFARLLQEALCCPHALKLPRDVDQTNLVDVKPLSAIVFPQNAAVLV
jgi:hypothetical protein